MNKENSKLIESLSDNISDIKYRQSLIREGKIPKTAREEENGRLLEQRMIEIQNRSTKK